MAVLNQEKRFQSRIGFLVRGIYLGLVLSLSGGLACDGEILEKPVSEKIDDKVAIEIREQIVDFYERARESGETVPDDIREWVEDDLERMWTWEYKVLRVDGTDPEQLQEELSALGIQRWECSLTAYPKPELTLLCKRPARSYLKMVPFKDVLRFFPGGGGGGE